jgi:hypothetical protein
MRGLLVALKIIWASPWTLVGLVIGAVGVLFGGRVQRHGYVIEFSDGLVRHLLRNAPFMEPGAMTLGHTILGQTQDDLEHLRNHELVHVRQYERWGPFFIPLYLGFTCYLWLRGKNPYYDNPFEREAYEKG